MDRFHLGRAGKCPWQRCEKREDQRVGRTMEREILDGRKILSRNMKSVEFT